MPETPPDTLPADFFPKQKAPPATLPADFFASPTQSPTTFTRGGGDLPEDLPQKAIRKGVQALPAIGAMGLAAVAPEGFLFGVGAAAAGGLIGSAAKQGIQHAMSD